VHDANSTSSPTSAESGASRILWILLIVATLYVCYFSNLGVIGFVGPDEPRYAWIARAMVETGDWVTPQLYGQPWFEKPVLYYWEAAVSFKIFGVSETAARLPSAFSALVGTLALAWLAWRVHGRETARWFLIFLPSTVGMIGFSHAAATDMPFAGMIAVAMVCAAVCLRLVQDDKTPILPRAPWLGLICFGVFLGLAVLAKGPAAIILCGGAIFLWTVFTKRWRDAFRLLHPVAIWAFCATALPWYAICARRNPDFFRIFIIEHNFKRYLTPEFQHIQPFWYYVPVLLVAFLPWIGVCLWSAVVGTGEIFRRRTVSDVTLLLICWPAFCVLFFSTSHSKLPGYILPAFPAVGLLLARSVVSVRVGRDRSFRYVHLAVGGTFLVLFAAAEVFSRGQSPGAALLASFSGVPLLLFAVANLTLGLVAAADGQKRPGHVAAWAVAPMLLAMLFTGVSAKYLLGSLLNDPSGKTIALELHKRKIPPTQLFVANMNRSLLYGLSFYLHGEVRNWDQQSGTGGYLLLGSKSCERIAGPGFYCEPRPLDLDSTGRFLYLVIPIAVEKVR
jgi:4-amino-4-deoxy-L-arabinose transferase-like glycosyltransferase